jgi:hypothetical protein
MAPQPSPPPPVIDPDNVPETLCDGLFNLSFSGQLAILTFTHLRPDAMQMFAKTTIVPSAIVRARIAMHLQNLVALRDFLNTHVQTTATGVRPTPATGGATKH